MSARSLTWEDVAWAREALSAGDSLSEIAETCECAVLDVAKALGVYGFRPTSLRWRQSIRTGEGYRPSPWIGGLLKEVARARCRAGDTLDQLTAEARVNREQMKTVLRGLLGRRTNQNFARAA